MARIPAGWYPRRGEVYWLRLDKEWPALIVSTDALNQHALDVCVVPITTVHHTRFALRVAIQAGEGGLHKDSWAKCDQVNTVEKTDLAYPPLGRLSKAAMSSIEEGIRFALELH
jgi:mRNA interferase MazF